VTMPAPRSGLARLLPEWACFPLALLLVVGTALLHLAYLAWYCPLDLAPDEAHYWDWSRHLDWSYYSKGPLVAWLIRVSCALAGGWSEEQTGSLTFAVRLPAVLCGSLVLLALYQLTVQVFARPRIALALVAICLTLPVIAPGRSLMTIDSPYTCCWSWALVFAHRAVIGKSSWAWEATGVMVGLGILAKYTMVIFVPSLALFLLSSREHRRLLFSSGFWSMLGISALACLPILIWNAQHDWVTVRHVLRLAGLQAGGEPALRGGDGGLHWLGPLAYLGAQAGILLGFWFVLWFCAMLGYNPLRQRDAGVRYLWWLSAPMFLLFLGFSLKTGGGEPNWPVTAYLSGGVLAAGWLARRLESSSPGIRWSTGAGVVLTCLLGAAGCAFLYNSESIHPLLEEITGPDSFSRPFPVRRFDPTCRLRGWRTTLAAEIDRLREELSAQGDEPVLASDSWSLPGELGIYCAGHPQAYTIGLMQGDRHSQYDFWTNPIDHPEAFLGRTFLIVGGIHDPVRSAFEHVEPAIRVTHRTAGRPVAGWVVYICHGFRGFAAKPQSGRGH
jgi:4-amino-4-deoxy-L-arabinose transferase-like glycosyltransferase